MMTNLLPSKVFDDKDTSAALSRAAESFARLAQAGHNHAAAIEHAKTTQARLADLIDKIERFRTADVLRFAETMLHQQGHDHAAEAIATLLEALQRGEVSQTDGSGA